MNIDFIKEEPILAFLMIIGVIMLFLGISPLLVSSETISLKKDEWSCTKSLPTTTLLPINNGTSTTNVPIKRNICLEYKRINNNY